MVSVVHLAAPVVASARALEVVSATVATAMGVVDSVAEAAVAVVSIATAVAPADLEAMDGTRAVIATAVVSLAVTVVGEAAAAAADLDQGHRLAVGADTKADHTA